MVERKNRSFFLTPAGEYFYNRTLPLVTDFETIVKETRRFSRRDKEIFKFGILRGFELTRFTEIFTGSKDEFANIDFDFIRGDHEELFECIKSNQVDLILSDQRRAFSNDYNNFELIDSPLKIICTKTGPFSSKKKVSVDDILDSPAYLIVSEKNFSDEINYYRSIFGIHSQFKRCNDLEEAKLKILLEDGFILTDSISCDSDLKSIPLYKSGELLLKKYCLFSKRNNENPYLYKFCSYFFDHINFTR